MRSRARVRTRKALYDPASAALSSATAIDEDTATEPPLKLATWKLG